jgi:DNA-binding NarL/FixJ family response regulator
MNGIDATRALKAVMPQVPIVMYTTFADSQMKNLALEAGVHDLVDKSENTFTLVRSIRNLLASEMPLIQPNRLKLAFVNLFPASRPLAMPRFHDVFR